MAQAIVVREYGGPEVLKLEEVVVEDPAPGQVRVRHTRIGVNFHDIYVRSGLYKTLELPGTPGIEAVGVVSAVGEGVAWKVGDRIAYVTGSYGVYASERLIDASLIFGVPDEISDEVAASALLRGLTVEMLLNRTHKVEPGTKILVQAAAGGVGQLLCQWASQIGAIVIGTAGNEDQVRLAVAAGCQHVINYLDEDVPARIRQITHGEGVDVVYDGIGKATFDNSLDSLAFRGHLVNYGQASGSVPPFEISRLAAKSNSISRPIIFHYVREALARESMARMVFSALSQGWLRVNPPREFSLSQASETHRILEKEGASVPLLLVP